MEGPGILRRPTDMTIGNWKDGIFQNSCGGRINKDGSEFFGELDRQMRPHGFGYHKFPGGAVTIGHWIHGNREGFCQTIYNDSQKSSYKGNYKDDLRDGKGEIEINGQKYTVEFEKNSLSKFISLRFRNGTIYEGDFDTKLGRHGMGKLTLPSGVTYTGYFKNDKMNGGFKVASEFQTFEGNYQNNKRQGFGMISILNNITIRVEYNQGKLVRCCFCKWFNGNVFRGKFHGYDYFGEMTFQNGKTIYGRLNTNWQFNPDYVISGISNKRNIDELSQENNNQNMGTKKVRFQ